MERSKYLVAIEEVIKAAEIASNLTVIKISDKINVTVAPYAGNKYRAYALVFRHKNAFYLTAGAPQNADRSKVTKTFNSGDATANLINAIKFAQYAEENGGWDIEIYPYN